MQRAVALRLAVETDVLRVTVMNEGDEALRLWARDNSWGWAMFSLRISPPDADETRELTARPVRWTRNLPRALNLPAGGELHYELRAGDPAWADLSAVEQWLDGPLEVRVKLEVPETPEAREQQVFIGEALSSPTLANPPHTWLTGPRPAG